MRTIILYIIFIAHSFALFAQDTPAGMVRYTPDFRFQDGIYANFNMVKHNFPIPKSRIVTDIGLHDRDFFKKLTESKRIVFYDYNGVQQELKSSNIWGYGRNGVLYVNIGNAFHRISFVGSICHFVATITTYNQGYYDPYYNQGYRSRYYRSPSSNTTSTEIRQYLIDFDTGKILDFEVSSVEIILMKDPELYDEYISLKKKKKKQFKFVYIRKYNESHPLYFPVR